jgi:hypothetical protein
VEESGTRRRKAESVYKFPKKSLKEIKTGYGKRSKRGYGKRDDRMF